MSQRLRRVLSRPLDRRFSGMQSRLDALLGQTRELADELQTLQASVQAVHQHLDRDRDGLLRAIAAGHSENRRALFELRRSPEYEAAFTDEHPLVTVAITTVEERAGLLAERALPSALAQDYSPLEVVIVSDDGGAQTRSVVQRLDDERVRYYEQTNRVAHTDRWQQFLSGQHAPRNYAHARARGQWVFDLDDDDALRPGAIRKLLELARARRAEVAYGVMERHSPDGTAERLGSFPPGPREPDWRERGLRFQPWDGCAGSGSLFHAGLAAIFGREYVAGVLGSPGDHFRLEQMVRAGVRFVMRDEVLYDYYPALLWEERR